MSFLSSRTVKRSAIVAFLLMSTFSFSLVSANTLAADVNTRMPQEHQVSPRQGTFSQSKNIKPLQRPFTSSGSFIYFPGKGLLWHTKKPVDSIKLFAKGGVYNIDEHGVRHQEAQLDNEFFLALFSADEQKLAVFFTAVKLEKATEFLGDCLALTPKSDTMNSLFTQINLCSTAISLGVKIPTSIELIEAKGNNTKIQLQLSADSISPEELAYFD